MSLRSILLVFIISTISLSAQTQEAHFGEINFSNSTSKKLTANGSNRQALFVSDSSILYVSKNRKLHKDPQLYFKDLLSGKEKRITHQRGQLSNGYVVPNEGRIFYSSTTDEDKESPFVLKKYLDRFPSSVNNESFFHINFHPSEIYQSKIDGSDIKRLTTYSGFDGFPYYIEAKDKLFFTRWQNGQLSLYSQSLKKTTPARKLMKTKGHDMGLVASPDQKSFVWYRFSPDFKSSQILLSNSSFKNPNYLTLESGINWSPTWHPKGKSIIFSSKQANKQGYDLFEVSVDGKCQRQLTSFAGDEFLPSISPRGDKIIFTSTQSGVEQIYQMNYPKFPDCSKEI